jgi:hypothetical protein
MHWRHSRISRILSVVCSQHAANLMGDRMVFKITGEIADANPVGGSPGVSEIRAIRQLGCFSGYVLAPTAGNRRVARGFAWRRRLAMGISAVFMSFAVVLQLKHPVARRLWPLMASRRRAEPV